MKRIKKHVFTLGATIGFCLAGSLPLAAQDYYVCAGNQASGAYEVYDPTVTDWNSAAALKWSFAPSTSAGWTAAQVAAYSNPSDMKLRWWGANGGQAVVTCASGGLATVATYPGGTMLWANDVGGSYNCHSVELLPDGNVVVAAADGNFVSIYTALGGSGNNSDSITLTGAHAVLWDPANNVIWALGTDDLLELSVGGSANSPTLSIVATIALPATGGHDLSPNYGDANSLWVTTSLNVYLFVKSTQNFYAAPGSVDRTAVKGCGNQPSGEIAQCQIDTSVCTLNTWCTPNVNFFTAAGAADYTRTKTGAAFYKCRIFTPDYQPNFKPILAGDFDGDGIPDSALFCADTGIWAIRFSHTASVHTFTFGQNGDIGLMHGDFDGDGEPDAVLFRPSNGSWYVRFSSNASIHNFSFGQAGDIPLLGGDFDGDGQPDAVIFRPSTAMWYVRFSSDASIHSFSFGESTDIPLLNGDWDGDGMPDAVLFRPSTGYWYVRFSKDESVHSFALGESGDVPIIGGDFNGTNEPPDAVVFQPSDVTWSIRNSTNATVQSFGLGQPSDIPLMNGDFDGDGQPDAVLYRPDNRTWYVRYSSDGSVNPYTYSY